MKKKKAIKERPFRNIPKGEVFRSDSEYYIKLVEDYACDREIYACSYFNAVNMSDGTLEYMDDEMLVLPIKSRLLIEL